MILAFLALAPAAQAACPVVPPPGLEAMAHPAATAPAVGRAASLTLVPAGPQPLASDRPARPGSFAGRYPLTIAAAGRYRIALSAPAWIDVVRDGASLVSAAHAHGAACSGVAKIVSFALPAGRYELRLSEAAAPAITVMVATDPPATPAAPDR